jgi:ribosome-binding factor A
LGDFEIMSRHRQKDRRAPVGPSQRQLRAGELVRHALVDILREEDFVDPALAGVSVTVSEVRMSPDLKHAIAFVEPLGGAHAAEVVAGLNRARSHLRGLLGHTVDLRFTPDLKFFHDETFDVAQHMDQLLADPRVRRDVEAGDDEGGQA